jgi:hypothetical protein
LWRFASSAVGRWVERIHDLPPLQLAAAVTQPALGLRIPHVRHGDVVSRTLSVWTLHWPAIIQPTAESSAAYRTAVAFVFHRSAARHAQRHAGVPIAIGLLATRTAAIDMMG